MEPIKTLAIKMKLTKLVLKKISNSVATDLFQFFERCEILRVTFSVFVCVCWCL